jgi:transcription antitermination factor NusG
MFWHVLHTAPNAESQICKYLAAQGLEGYAPRFPAPPRTRRGSVRDRRARWVFPCYLFVSLPPGFSRWDVIRWAPGVRRVLQQDGLPATVSDHVIDHLHRRLAEGTLDLPRSGFTRGQRVLIERGPLAAVDAIFERELDAPARVRILIRLLGRDIPVEVSAELLRPTG